MAKNQTVWFKEQIRIYGRIPVHLSCATDMTKYGVVNMEPSPFYFRRHGASRIKARQEAKWNMPNGSNQLPFPNRAKGACIYGATDHVPTKKKLRKEQIDA